MKNFGLLLLLLIMIVPLCMAHVPQTTGGNDSIENALEVKNPLKSWVYYDAIDSDSTARYYKAYYEKEEKIYVSALTPDKGEFLPSILIFGPGLIDGNPYPDYIRLYESDVMDTIVLNGVKKNAEYEPFTPSSYYHTAETTIIAPESGTYYFVIFAEGVGKVALAIGYVEGFTPLELIKVPIDTISIHKWEGQSYAMILFPFVIMSILVIIYGFFHVNRNYLFLTHILSLISGSLFMGSFAYTIFQMIRAILISGISPIVGITLILAGLSLILGISLVRWGISITLPSKMDRARFFGFGLFGFVIFGGMILGPLLCLIIAFIPNYHLIKNQTP